MTNIWSEEQLKLFYDAILKDLGPTETDFFCLAARKKYMTDEQKKSINLGDTCMMNKVILKEHDFKKFLSKVHQADACSDYFTDRDGNYIPRSCIVFYVNVNHTNVLASIKDFKKLLADWDYDVASLVDFRNHNKIDNIGRQLKTIQNNLLKAFQDPKNTNKKWIDIDCDLNIPQTFWVAENSDREFFYKNWEYFLKGYIKTNLRIEPYIIKTHGGCHVLINLEDISKANKSIAERTEDKKTIKDKIVTVEKILNLIGVFFGEHKIIAKEIVVNQNMMIPMPGTIQGGFKVEII